MKVRPSVKPMCEKCKIIKRKGRVMVICENPRHKQKAGLIWLELSGAATRTLTAAAMRREGSERKSSMNAESPKCTRSAEPTRRSPKGKANAGVR